jgi:phage shock protein PspC (stress-responsive transcriptional regulator)
MSEHITHTPQIKRLERSSDRVLAGVSSGLGRYFDLNPAVFRLGFVILTLLGGAGILVYLAAVLVIPAEGSEQSIAAEVLAERRERPWPVVGLGLAGVALVLLLSRGDVWPGAGAGWLFALIGGLAIVWASRRQKRGRRILVALAVVLTFVAVAATVAVVAAFAWLDVSLGDGTGDRTYTPAAAADVRPSYHLGIGNLKVDLSQLEPASTQHVRARLGIGELKIVVPRDANVHVDAHAKAGELFVLHNHDDGTNATVHTGDGQLRIDAKVGAGRIDVVRAR